MTILPTSSEDRNSTLKSEGLEWDSTSTTWNLLFQRHHFHFNFRYNCSELYSDEKRYGLVKQLWSIKGLFLGKLPKSSIFQTIVYLNQSDLFSKDNSHYGRIKIEAASWKIGQTCYCPYIVHKQNISIWPLIFRKIYKYVDFLECRMFYSFVFIVHRDTATNKQDVFDFHRT